MPSLNEISYLIKWFNPLAVGATYCTLLLQQMVASKIIHYLYVDGIRRSVPQDHSFSSLDKPHGAKL